MPPGLRYPDRRGQFANTPQWSVPAGTGREDNKGQRTPSENLATRTTGAWEQNEKGEHIYKPGSKNPRTDFRTTTAPKPAESNQQPPPEPQSPEYARTESLTTPPGDPKPALQTTGLFPSVSSGTLERVLGSDDGPASQESQLAAYSDG